MVGKRLLYILEVTLLLTLFAFFTSFVVTTSQNDQIVDATEEFAEFIRYKGVITEKTYDDFLTKIPTAVKVSFVIDKGHRLTLDDQPLDEVFTQEVFAALDDESKGYYPLQVGDSIKVIVRKTSPTLFDKTTELLTGQSSGELSPIIAIKGGLVLNEQYH